MHNKSKKVQPNVYTHIRGSHTNLNAIIIREKSSQTEPNYKGEKMLATTITNTAEKKLHIHICDLYTLNANQN